MQLNHTPLPHAAVPELLRLAPVDPLLLSAPTLAPLLVHERHTAGFDFLVAVVGGRRGLEAGAQAERAGLGS